MGRTPSHRIVIVGGGAGGLALATKLGQRLGKRGKAEITLVDRNLVHVWKPLFHEVAAGTLDSREDAISFLAQASRNHFQFQIGSMSGLDREAKTIEIAAMYDETGHKIVPARTLPYDTLIIAVGSISNHFGTPGAEEHCLHLDTLTEAENFQRKLVQVLLRAQALPPAPGNALKVAIIGGGATGVELAAELHNAAHRAVHYGLKNIDPERDLKITLIEGAERLLPPLSPKLSAKTEIQLRKIGVDVRTGELVTEVRKDGVTTKSGQFLPSDITVWAAGIKAPEFLTQLGLETNRINQLVVRQDLRTTQDDNIFAFGDCASCPQPGSDRPVPPRAQSAHQQAEYLARTLPRHIAKHPVKEGFVYYDRGSLISLSEDHAVGRLMGNLFGNVMIEGMLARLAYTSLYKRHLATLNGPLRTTVMSAAQLLTRPIKPRLKLH